MAKVNTAEATMVKANLVAVGVELSNRYF